MKRQGSWQLFLLFSAIGWLTISTTTAQEASGRAFITGNDVSSPPSVELHVYGYNSTGGPIDFAGEGAVVQHEGVTATEVEVQGPVEKGTFTIFLLDIPDGIVPQLGAIQEAVLAFAQAPTMKEQIDAVAIYKVGPTTAVPLLPPDRFYNTIRNFFTEPLAPETGPTALVDSLVSLINEANTLKPDPAMAVSIVVFSDGTDAVSSRFQPEDVPGQAVGQGVAVHTVWVENSNLSEASQQNGREYMAQAAASSWGLAATLADVEALAAIWNRIASFRDQTRLRYLATNLTGGASAVTLSLAGTPATQAETVIDVPPDSPMVTLNVPPESRILSLPDVNRPVTLHFSADLDWLDGEERGVEAVQLQVNGVVVPNLAIEDVRDFEVEITNLVYGSNVIQIALLDDQGRRVTSPPLLLTVNEGPEEIPEILRPGAGVVRILGTIAVLLVVIALLVGVVFLAWRSGFRLPLGSPRGRRQRAATKVPVPLPEELPGYTPRPEGEKSQAKAYLEVLESVTEMPPEIGLSLAEVRIGRSPAQSNIPFENDITMSRLHATLMLEGSRYRIYDAGSTSGTWVNEQAVPEYGLQLVDGDEIFLGAVHLRFRQL
jgi:hypothetical protein